MAVLNGFNALGLDTWLLVGRKRTPAASESNYRRRNTRCAICIAELLM